MHRPHLSTGAWLFCGIVTAALIAPAGVYAAVNSKVAIGNVGSSTTTATVDAEHQLLTTMVDPRRMIRLYGSFNGTACHTLYTPPRGRALMITNLTFEVGSGVAGNTQAAWLENRDCNHVYDQADTTQAFETQQRTYPAGLPVDGVGLITTNSVAVEVVGYLIPASQLPPSIPSVGTPRYFPHR
jgi:hypothetical protein